MIRLIALDLDGTLLDDDHRTISGENRGALRFAARRGAKIALASGRTFIMMQDAIAQAGCVDYALISNGAAIVDPGSGAPLFDGGRIPPEQAKRLFEVLAAYPVSYRAYCEGRVYWDERSIRRSAGRNLPIAFLTNSLKKMDMVDDVPTYLEGRALEKIYVSDIDKDSEEGFRCALEQLGELEFTSSIPDTIEINRAGVSKGAALAAFCQKLGIAPQDVMAFGDSDNDETMLRWAGWSFAMGNADGQVKRAAKFVAPENTAHGVAKEVVRVLTEQSNGY